MTFTIVRPPHGSKLEYVHDPKDSEKSTEFTSCIFSFNFQMRCFFKSTPIRTQYLHVPVYLIQAEYFPSELVVSTEISNSIFHLKLVTKLSTQAKQVYQKHCCV